MQRVKIKFASETCSIFKEYDGFSKQPLKENSNLGYFFRMKMNFKELTTLKLNLNLGKNWSHFFSKNSQTDRKEVF